MSPGDAQPARREPARPEPAGEPATTSPATTSPAATSSAATGIAGTGPAASHPQPVLTVVRGAPTADEMAALIVVVDALVRRADQRPAPERPDWSRWAAKEQLVRPQLRPGPGAWRASALPT